MMVLGGFGVFKEVLGGVGGPEGVYFTPIRHFLPLWKSCRAPDLVPDTT